jgi:hypothetical protein
MVWTAGVESRDEADDAVEASRAGRRWSTTRKARSSCPQLRPAAPRPREWRAQGAVFDPRVRETPQDLCPSVTSFAAIPNLLRPSRSVVSGSHLTSLEQVGTWARTCQIALRHCAASDAYHAHCRRAAGEGESVAAFCSVPAAAGPHTMVRGCGALPRRNPGSGRPHPAVNQPPRGYVFRGVDICGLW